MAVPEFPQFKDIELPDREVVDDFLSRFPIEASEYTFTNIFAFRFAYKFKVSIMKDNLIILKDINPFSMFCPVGNVHVQDTVEKMFRYLQDKGAEPYLERVPESFVEAHIRKSENFIIEEDKDQFDYVYNTRELIELRGNKFHDKKNKVNKFRSHYQYEYLPLTSDLIDECLEYEDYWCQERDCGKYPGLHKERCAILEMLNNFDDLQTGGGVIRVGGKISALTLGEKYLSDTFVIHVEKANTDIPGLYQTINQEFLMHEAGKCRFVNREQDLGIQGLRRAKRSYNPVDFVKKYKVRKRG
jgi:hypothetical protein